MSLLAVLLFSFSLCGGTARGEEPVSEESVPEIHFRLLAWNAPVNDLSYAQEGGTATAVTLLPNGFSQPFPCLAGKAVSFFRTTTAADGSKTRVEAAAVPADQLTRDALLLFQNDPAQPGRFTVRVMPDDPVLDSQTGFRFMNFSSEALQITCAGISVALPPQGTISIHVPESNPGEIVGVEVRATKDGTPRLVYSNRWAYSRTVTSLVFIYQGESSLQLKRIPYSPHAPQAEVKSTPAPEPEAASTPARKKRKGS
jgi:hypothetical protein